MKRFLLFKSMITPIALQAIFWIGSVCCVIFGLIDIVSHHRILMGVQIIILGPIALRIVAECLLIPFQIYNRLDSTIQNPK